MKGKIGSKLHIPSSTFPDEECPACGYWVAKAVSTSMGGTGDVGLLIEDSTEEVFIRQERRQPFFLNADGRVTLHSSTPHLIYQTSSQVR